MMPMPTPAAKSAVIAAALAISSALSTVKKYGEHQNAKTAISRPHSRKMPRSRRKTSTDTMRGTSSPVGTGAGPALLAPASATFSLVTMLIPLP